jgi:hypothetical protein
MFNAISQNNVIPSHLNQNGKHQVNKQQQMLTRTWGWSVKRTLYAVGWNVNYYSHYRNQYGDSSRN